MRTIIHISDIHFGKIKAPSVNSLIRAFTKIDPDLLIISGDLTQRAKVEEFKSARSLLIRLEKLGLPYFVIPGNHDIEPLYKPFSRMLNPYHCYRKYIQNDLEPTWSDEELAVASVNTVRSSRFKGGGVNLAEVKKVVEWFSQFSKDTVKIVVTHHPLDLPLHRPKRKLARKAEVGIEELSRQSVDMYLSGHYHLSSIVHTAERYNIDNYCAVAVQAGTVSTRQRGEVESFNVLKVDRRSLSVQTMLWNPERNNFEKKAKNDFIFDTQEWKRRS